MATRLNSVQTESVLNVSQDHSTSPAREIPDSQPTGGFTQLAAGALIQAAETQVVIKDSYDRSLGASAHVQEHFDENHDTTPRKSQTVPTQPADSFQSDIVAPKEVSEDIPPTVPPKAASAQPRQNFEVTESPQTREPVSTSTSRPERSSSNKSNTCTVQSKESVTSDPDIMASTAKTASKLPQTSTKSRGALAKLREKRGETKLQQDEPSGTRAAVNSANPAVKTTASTQPVASGKLKSATALGKQNSSKNMLAASQAPTGSKRKSEEPETGLAEATKRSRPSTSVATQPVSNANQQTQDKSIERDAAYDDEIDSEDEPPKAKRGKRGGRKAVAKKGASNPQPTSSSYAPTKDTHKLSRDLKPVAKAAAAKVDTRRSSTRLQRGDESSELERADISDYHHSEAQPQIRDAQVVDDTVPMPAPSKNQSKNADQEQEEPEVSQPVTKRHRAVAKTSKAGSTQNDALVISDREESSPMPEDMQADEPDPQPAAAHRPDTTLLKTPAAVRSSPPVTKGFVDGDDEYTLDHAALSSKKATIVAFGKDGPRNQGVLATRTPGNKLGRSSMPPSKDPFTGRTPAAQYGRSSIKRKKGLSSAATSQRTGRSIRRVKSSNVGDSLSQVMGEMYPTTKASKIAPVQNDDDFANIDDYDEQAEDPPRKFKSTTTIVQAKIEAVVPSAVAPIAAKSPETTTLVTHKQASVPAAVIEQEAVMAELNDVQPVEDQEFDGTTVMPSPPPVPRKSKKAVQPRPEPKMPPPARHAAPSRQNRQKEHAATAPPVTVSEQQAILVVETAAKSRPKRGIAAVEAVVERPSKQVKLADVEKPTATTQPKAVAAPLPTRSKQPVVQKVASKPSRHISQGSQTVDRDGSPIPQGMNIQDTTQTVLQTYSQQVASPPQVAKSKTQARRTPEAEDIDSETMDTAYVAPPSHQPEKQHIMSSNAKPIPASPRAESATLTYRNMSPSKSRKLLEKTSHRVENPFARAQDTASAQDTPVTALHKKHTRQIQQKARPGRPARNTVLSELQPTEQLRRAPARKAAAVRVSRDIAEATSTLPSSGDEFLGQLATQLSGESAAVAEAEEEEEDMGTTLVDYDEPLSDKPEMLASNTRGATDDLPDPPVWVATLKPHQVSLFDQMVACVQQLTHYMFEQENGTEQMLDEYHRRNLYLIEQEEKQQVKNYRQMEKTLRMKKKEKLSRAKQYHQALVRQAEEFEQEKKQQRKRRAEWDAENEELQAFIDEHA